MFPLRSVFVLRMSFKRDGCLVSGAAIFAIKIQTITESNSFETETPRLMAEKYT